jgi:hypothetical protein
MVAGMIANPWSLARMWRRAPAGVAGGGLALALTLVGCAAGDLASEGDNPFTTNKPGEETGMPVTDGAATEPGTGGTTGGPTSESNSASASASVTNTTPSSASDTEPEDPTENPDPDCVDDDDDGYGMNCQLGEDCDDADYNNHTPDGCSNCVDKDGDNYWVGCDQYGEVKPGPDCDDGNDKVGAMDADELCDGIAQNCAGEIDPLPPEDMCPTTGDSPNVAPVGGWKCNAVAPGEDGCEIAACSPGFYDANKTPGDGCECVGTDRNKSLEACSDDPKGALPVLAEGGVVPPLKGVIAFVDNGPGNAMEDWYSVSFPEAMAMGARPNAGNISVSFAVNPGDPANPDYRLEVYRNCAGKAFDGALATQFGPGAPPAREWTFIDTPMPMNPSPNPNYKNDVPWPEKVYIRVIRVNNSGTCGEYTLQISRAAN